MKKYIYIAVASLFAFAACEKEAGVQEEVTPVEEPVAKEQVTITASIPEEGLTKVALTPQDGTTKTVKLEWEVDDVITINGEEFEIDETTISGDKKSATFKGATPTPVDGKYTIAYTKAPTGGFADQQQSADGAYDHLGYNVTLGDVTDYSNVTFSSDWAVVNSATFSQASVLWLRALLPSTVAENVKKVIVKASQNVFNGTNTFTVSLDTPGVQSGDDKLDIYATIPEGAVTSGAMDLLVQFQVDADYEYDKYTAYRQIPGGTDFGQSQYIGINCASIESYANKSNVGIGTVSNPYLIGDMHQLQSVNSHLSASSENITYFTLVDEIDLQGIDNWTPIDTQKKSIYFNGNNKTINNLKITSGTYCGLFAILYGTVKNLTIDNASVSGATKANGILTGYICANTGKTIGCAISGITIRNATLKGNGQYCGAIGGVIGKHASNTFAINISDITISDSSIKSTQSCGSLLGYTQYESSVNRSLSISGVDIVNSSVEISSDPTTEIDLFVGGLIGKTDDPNATISNVNIKGTDVSGCPTKVNAVGGIVGLVSDATTILGCTYEKSDARTATVTGPTKHNGAESTHGAFIGGIAGEVSGDASFDDCHVKNAKVTFDSPSSNTSYWKDTGGAFGYVHSSGAKIGHTTKCTVENVTVEAYHYCGGFIGYMDGGTVENSEVSNLSLSGRNYVGGFIGEVNSGTVLNCSTAGDSIDANATVGGFFGKVNNGTFSDNSTTLQLGTSSAEIGANLGGFVAVVGGTSSFTRCHSYGDVYSSGSNIGGFVGDLSAGEASTFSNCSVNASNVSGANTVAGFCGNYGNIDFKVSFEDCHVAKSDGSPHIAITGKTGGTVAGFIGWAGGETYANNTGTITKCSVSNAAVSSNGAYTGGFAAVIKTDVSKSFVINSTITSPKNAAAGFTGYLKYATITDSFAYNTNISVNNNNVGGFVGNFVSGTVEYSYYQGSISGTGNHGGFSGTANGTINSCILWLTGLDFSYGGTVSGTNNYTMSVSETGTILSHAQTLGWNFSTIWNALNPPTLQ